MIKRYIAIAILAFVASGCMVGPKYTSPALNTPSEYTNQSDSVKQDTSSVMEWWQLFEDKELQDMVRIALVQNKDIRMSMAKVEEARAVLGMAKADLYPKLGVSASAAYRHFGANDASYLNGWGGNVVGQLDWEIDIWGRVRHSNKAAYAQMMSDVETLNALSVSVVSEVANLYFQLISLGVRAEITQSTIKARQENYRIINERFLAGYVPEIDAQQALQQLAVAQTILPEIERDIVAVENALAVALGQNPGMEVMRPSTLTGQLSRLEIPAGLPSELLQRRPDIKAAEQVLIAQTHAIGVAQAMRYPSVNLAVLGGFASRDLINLFGPEGGLVSAGASLMAPVFNAGKNKRRVEAERAKTEQALQQYEKTVLKAFSEVETALKGIESYKKQIVAYKVQVDANQRVLDLSQLRYDAGFVTYLEVLTSETRLFESQLNLLVAEQNQLFETVKLFKALGGGW